MGDADALAQIQASLQAILEQNRTFVEEIAELKRDNAELRSKAEDKEDRIAKNKAKWAEATDGCTVMLQTLEELKEKLLKDNVESSFFEEDDNLNRIICGFASLSGRKEAR